MRHKWIKDKSFKPSGIYYAKATCSRCGLVKLKSCIRSEGQSFFEEQFERSGVFFGASTNHNLECVDWKEGNVIDPLSEEDNELYF